MPRNPVPTHDVKLDAISGASAGAMTAAITAIALQSKTEPARYGSEPNGEKNRLYDVWVRQIDIHKLLDVSDLKQGRIVSILNSEPLVAIAQSALLTEPLDQPRRWVGDPLVLFFTIANLRGVSYGFHLCEHSDYFMRNHMDDMRFAIGDHSKKHEDIPQPLCTRLLMGKQARCDCSKQVCGDWQQLVLSALASGAFPIGLAARHLNRPRNDYEPSNSPWEEIHSTPHFDEKSGKEYNFWAVDGGLLNNEPLRLVRNYLREDVNIPNKREGDNADRALILIDPFPNDENAENKNERAEGDSLLCVLQQMFSALKNQARFHANDLELVEDPEVFSRFAIWPSRHDGKGKTIQATCAAWLGGFGGFLAEQFRHHDFHLGRRNCQRFLAEHFTLGEKNRVFDKNRNLRIDLSPWSLRDADNHFIYRDFDGRPCRMVQIIPLVGRAKKPVDCAPWPDGLDEAEIFDLAAHIDCRARWLGGLLAEAELPKLWHASGKESTAVTRFIIRLVGTFLGHCVGKKAINYAQDKLKMH